MSLRTRITGVGEAAGTEQDSLETLIYRSATRALRDAGLERGDLDGVVLAASDQIDGRAISSMLTSGPAGAYLNEEINVASSPGHALALGHLQILSGTHRRLLVTSWGKRSETAGAGTQAAERLSLDPFFERDVGLSPLALVAMQAQRHRSHAPDWDTAARAAAAVAARNHGADAGGAAAMTAEAVAASPMHAFPLRAFELPAEVDGSFSVLLEASASATASQDPVELQGLAWCSDTARLAERDLLGLPHLRHAAAAAFAQAGVTRPREAVDLWELHDYSPDAELLAYGAVGLCEPGEALEAALQGLTDLGAAQPVNPGGGSVRGEAPFGGPLRKVVDAVLQLRGAAHAGQVEDAQRSFVQIAGGIAGQFQSAIVLGRPE